MWQLILRRLVLFIPILLLISMLIFGLTRLTPGDPVSRLVQRDDGTTGSQADLDSSYVRKSRQLGLYGPLFYVTLQSAAYPDTLYRIVQPLHRRTVERLISQYGNWPAIQDFYRQWQLTRTQLAADNGAAPTVVATLNNLLAVPDLSALAQEVDSLRHSSSALVGAATPTRTAVAQVVSEYDQVVATATPAQLWVPELVWHGTDNQYHRWLVRFIRGDFGYHYHTGVAIGDTLWPAVRITLVINGLAILLAYLLAIPIGVYAGVNAGGRFDRWSSLLLFGLYSLPNFWVAVLLTTFFATSLYGMNWFPASWNTRYSLAGPDWHHYLHQLVLPVGCLVYGSLAFISRQMRNSMIQQMQQPYVRTARAKGLSTRQVVWKHAFRNALFPIITMLGEVLPAALAGSVVIEYIFNIPGMGRATIEAITQQNYPVVFTLVMLAGVLTVAGILLSDILYKLVNPRVDYRATAQ